MLGLHFCARAFSSCGKRGPLFIAVRRPLTIAASPVAEHKLQMRRLSSCGSRAQSLHGMWDLPRPGLEPVSPALAGRFSTTAPPGKPHMGSLVAACGLSVVACRLLVAARMRDLVPRPGIEPGPATLGVWSLTHWITREVPTWFNFEDIMLNEITGHKRTLICPLI